MKKRDLFYLVLAAVILMAGGYLAYVQLTPKKGASEGVPVEVVGTIPDAIDSAPIKNGNPKDYNSPVDFSGLGNPSPFGQ